MSEGYSSLLGPVSVFDKTSYCKIWQSLEAVRFVFRIVRLSWSLEGTSAALLPRCLSISKRWWFKLRKDLNYQSHGFNKWLCEACPGPSYRRITGCCLHNITKKSPVGFIYTYISWCDPQGNMLHAIHFQHYYMKHMSEGYSNLLICVVKYNREHHFQEPMIMWSMARPLVWADHWLLTSQYQCSLFTLAKY